jgi:hypothetical protein
LKFELADNLLSYLSEQGAADVTLDLEEIPSNCCLGRLPEMKISLGSPPNTDAYRHFEVGGIHIHLSKLLRTRETLKLFLTGLGPFKKVEAAGVNLVL